MVEVLGVGWALRRALFDSFVGIVLFDSFVGIVLFDSFVGIVLFRLLGGGRRE